MDNRVLNYGANELSTFAQPQFKSVHGRSVRGFAGSWFGKSLVFSVDRVSMNFKKFEDNVIVEMVR
jgi:hypothetical protein